MTSSYLWFDNPYHNFYLICNYYNDSECSDAVDFPRVSVHWRRHRQADAHGGQEVLADRQGLDQDHVQVSGNPAGGALLPERYAEAAFACAGPRAGVMPKVAGVLSGGEEEQVPEVLLRVGSCVAQNSVARIG